MLQNLKTGYRTSTRLSRQGLPADCRKNLPTVVTRFSSHEFSTTANKNRRVVAGLRFYRFGDGASLDRRLRLAGFAMDGCHHRLDGRVFRKKERPTARNSTADHGRDCAGRLGVSLYIWCTDSILARRRV